MTDDDSVDDEILREYLPIFECLRRQALPSGGNNETHTNIPGEETLRTAFADDFTNINESASSSTINKKVSKATKESSNDDNFMAIDEIVTYIDECQYKTEKEIIDCDRDDPAKMDKNQNAPRKIDVDKKPPTENKAATSNKRLKPSKFRYFPEYSYLHRIEGHIAKCVSTQIPELLIQDILKAKHYIILDKLCSDRLYETRGLVFNNFKCRGTVAGISHGNTFQFVVSDGTGSVRCVLVEEMAENTKKSPIIENFDTHQVSCETITSAYDLERGETVQIMGYLEEHFNKLRVVVKQLCKEESVNIGREIEYLDHLEKLKATLSMWQRNVDAILKY